MMLVSVAIQDIHIHPKDYQCTSGVFTKKHWCDLVAFLCCFFSLTWQTIHSDCHRNATCLPPNLQYTVASTVPLFFPIFVKKWSSFAKNIRKRDGRWTNFAMSATPAAKEISQNVLLATVLSGGTRGFFLLLTTTFSEFLTTGSKENSAFLQIRSPQHQKKLTVLYLLISSSLVKCHSLLCK